VIDLPSPLLTKEREVYVGKGKPKWQIVPQNLPYGAEEYELFNPDKIPEKFRIEQRLVNSSCNLFAERDSVINDGGEGIILRRKRSYWYAGRTDDIRKMKGVRDVDATIVEIIAGKGRLEGSSGAVVLEMENGTKFRASTYGKDYEVGTVVNVLFREFTNGGVPKEPRLRDRT
jgi:ATP-dependent DNA ligase